MRLAERSPVDVERVVVARRPHAYADPEERAAGLLVPKPPRRVHEVRLPHLAERERRAPLASRPWQRKAREVRHGLGVGREPRHAAVSLQIRVDAVGDAHAVAAPYLERAVRRSREPPDLGVHRRINPERDSPRHVLEYPRKVVRGESDRRVIAGVVVDGHGRRHERGCRSRQRNAESICSHGGPHIARPRSFRGGAAS